MVFKRVASATEDLLEEVEGRRCRLMVEDSPLMDCRCQNKKGKEEEEEVELTSK